MMGMEKSRDAARERLGGVLREDRTAISMRELELIRLDLLAALSPYLEMERENARTEVSRERPGGQSKLVFTVPICTVKHRRN